MKLPKNWDILRIARLVLGLSITVSSITSGDYMLLIIAAVFLWQALFNVSCCGPSGCSIESPSPKEEKIEKERE